MSLEKAIESGKEKRKEYHGAKSVDRTCRNHGSCPYCQTSRMHTNKKRLLTADEQEDEFWAESTGAVILRM